MTALVKYKIGEESGSIEVPYELTDTSRFIIERAKTRLRGHAGCLPVGNSSFEIVATSK